MASDKITIMFSSDFDDPEAWREAMIRQLPETTVDYRVFPDGVGDPAEIEYALVWRHPHGDLVNYPGLKAILSLAAGPEAILEDPDLPKGVPVVRLVDTSLTDDIVQYCVHWVLHLHREFQRNMAAAREGRWDRPDRQVTEERTVGIMGLGELGARTAAAVSGFGFRTAGWSRTPKDLPDVESFAGDAGLEPFLRRTEILVCLLPLTPNTRDILNRDTLAMLPAGASVINAGRGAHVVDEDLLAALDSGHLSTAVLDVFREEPLPSDSPLWRHPQVVATPHIAGRTYPGTAAAVVAENIRRVERGEAPHPVIDQARQY